MSDAMARLFDQFDRGHISRRHLLQALGVAAVVRPAAAFAQGTCGGANASLPRCNPTPAKLPFERTGGTTVLLDHFTMQVADYKKEAAYFNALMNWKIRSDDGKQAVLDIGDWGGFITSRLGAVHADKLLGAHVNLLAIPRDASFVPDPNADEQRFLDELALFAKEETGYQWIQGTRPQTLAYAWQRCDDDQGTGCVAISGASAASYTTESADVGKYLRSQVTATNLAGSAAAFSSGYVRVTAAATASTPTNSGRGRRTVTRLSLIGAPRQRVYWKLRWTVSVWLGNAPGSGSS